MWRTDALENGQRKSCLRTQHLKNEAHGIWSHHFMLNRKAHSGNTDRLYFPQLQNHSRCWMQPWNSRHLLLGRKATTNPESTLKSRDINLLTKVHPVKAMAFPTVMDGCENWTIKELSANELMLLNCGVGQDSWESPGFPEHQPVDPKENQSWIFIGRTDAEAPTVWLHDVKNWCTGKDANPGKDWRQE